MTAAAIIATVLGSITVGISYAAYILTRERFRLDLFEKRWAVYESADAFCSVIFKYGGVPRGTHSSVDEDQNRLQDHIRGSLAGIGFQSAKALFGPEIEKFLGELRSHYAWFSAYSNQHGPETANEWHQRITRVLEMHDEMPDLFAPYINFSDYKWKRKSWALSIINCVLSR